MKMNFNMAGFTTSFAKALACLTLGAMVFTSCEDAIEEVIDDILVESVSVSPTSTSIVAGTTTTLTATITPSDASLQTVTWSSSDTSVATVADGVVTGVAEGVATITVKSVDGGYTATCEITVTSNYVAVTSISLDEEILSLDEDETYELVVTFDPATATEQGITWTSSNETVATVADGVVTAVAAGEATITATSVDNADAVATCAVTVVEFVPTPVSSITLSYGGSDLTSDSEVEVYAAGTATLVATVSEDATDPSVTWSIAFDEGYTEGDITISDSGVVAGVTVGATATVTVTAADGSEVSASCKIKVIEKPATVFDYSIGSESELAAFRDAVNAGSTTLNAQLTADITLTTDSWAPIGTEEYPYAGIFDGAGYTISDLFINGNLTANTVTTAITFGFTGNSNTASMETTLYNSPYLTNVGFFGTTSGATIQNLTISGGESGFVFAAMYVGGVIGHATNTTIINCTGDVNTQAYSRYAGTIAGYAKGCTVIACVGTAQTVGNGKSVNTVTVDDGNNKDAAGLICYVDDCDIIGCYTIGAVRTAYYGQGGMVGTMLNGSKVSGCYAAAAVFAAAARGFAYESTGTTFDAAYWVEDIESLGFSTTYDAATGTITYETESEGTVETITAATLNTSATVDALNTAIVAAGVSDYAFVVGTDTTYPVIQAVE